MRFWKLGRRIEVCNLSGTRCILRSLSQCQFPWAPSFLNRYWRRWSTRLIPLRDFGGASGFQYASKPPLPTSRSHLSRCHPRIREVHCNMLQCCATKWYLIHLSLIWIFHEYKYSESDGGTQTQQNGFILRWNYFQKWHLQFDTRSCWIWESFLGILCFKWQSANITETHGASGKVTSWRPGVELGDMGCSTSLSLWCPISISVYIYI